MTVGFLRYCRPVPQKRRDQSNKTGEVVGEGLSKLRIAKGVQEFHTRQVNHLLRGCSQPTFFTTHGSKLRLYLSTFHLARVASYRRNKEYPGDSD